MKDGKVMRLRTVLRLGATMSLFASLLVSTPSALADGALGGGAGGAGGAGGLTTTYTVTYDGNCSNACGLVPMDSGSPYTTGSSVTILTAPNLIRPGRSLDGWLYGGGMNPVVLTAGQTFTIVANTTLSAVWSYITYTLSYDGNGNTGGSAPSGLVGYGPYTLANNTGGLVKSGYTFAGWNTQSNGLGTAYPVLFAYNITSTLTLYAQWTPNLYNVTYDGNCSNTCGTVPTDSANPHQMNSSVTVLGAPTSNKPHFTFGGWLLGGLSGSLLQPGQTFPITGDTTLAALWNPDTFTLTYDGNGNSGGSVPPPTINGGSVSVANNTGGLVKVGYAFGGWDELANGQGALHGVTTVYNLAADITFYAVWTRTSPYTITYNGSGNTGGTVPNHTVGLGTVALAGNPQGMVKSLYMFDGWTSAPNGGGQSYAIGYGYTLTSDVTLYAKWTRSTNTRHIIYLGNSNTAGSVPGMTYGLGMVTLATNSGGLARTGYTFDGWVSATNNSSHGGGTLFNLTTNTTMTAKWRRVITHH